MRSSFLYVLKSIQYFILYIWTFTVFKKTAKYLMSLLWNAVLVWIHICLYAQPYPDGWNLPGGGAQRGNVLNLNGAGDPLTPGYPAKGVKIDTSSMYLFFLSKPSPFLRQIISTDSDLKMESDFPTFLCIQLVTMMQFTCLSKCFFVPYDDVFFIISSCKITSNRTIWLPS